ITDFEPDLSPEVLFRDGGGPLPTGYSIVQNNLGHEETILPKTVADVSRTFERLEQVTNEGGVTITDSNFGPTAAEAGRERPREARPPRIGRAVNCWPGRNRAEPRPRRRARCRPRRYFRGAGVRGARGSAPVPFRLPYPEAHLVRHGWLGVEPRRPRFGRVPGPGGDRGASHAADGRDQPCLPVDRRLVLPGLPCDRSRRRLGGLRLLG